MSECLDIPEIEKGDIIEVVYSNGSDTLQTVRGEVKSLREEPWLPKTVKDIYFRDGRRLLSANVATTQVLEQINMDTTEGIGMVEQVRKPVQNQNPCPN